MTMTQRDFAALVDRFAACATRGDGEGLAACFTQDGVYHDYIYGPHRGRPAIAHMLTGLFHRDATDYDWRMFDPVTDGATGYAWSLSAFTSTIEEFKGRRVIVDGMSRFTLKDGLIESYRESVNGGIPMAQLGVAAGRMERVMQKWSDRLKSEPQVKAYLQGLGRADRY
jgi:ketosteroid isomerase-like protein